MKGGKREREESTYITIHKDESTRYKLPVEANRIGFEGRKREREKERVTNDDERWRGGGRGSG